MSGPGRPARAELAAALAARWPQAGLAERGAGGLRIAATRTDLVEICDWLHNERRLAFAALVVEERARRWRIAHHLYGERLRVEVGLEVPLREATVPSVSEVMHAADWHEREVEDLFGLRFEGHPKLGEFVLHEHWPEGVNPMRRDFDPGPGEHPREPEPGWRPPAIVEAPGAFLMPVGPIYTDFAEAAHFQLETVGEEVIVTEPRLFYKYRAVEKLAEGRRLEEVLLLAERFSGTSAFAHALAFCQAAEAIAGCQVPVRARRLRTAIAELERLRHHAAAIAALVASTALAVAQAQAERIEERLLRLAGALLGHRYLFGLACPGGLTRDLDAERCARLIEGVAAALGDLERLAEGLTYTSSFLDRIEEVGVVSPERARAFGLVGPVARGSGQGGDLRVLLPYAAYPEHSPQVALEHEGDGYARLRVLLGEARAAAAIVAGALTALPTGPVASPFRARAGEALGAVEAPLGAAFHWLRVGRGGRVARYRIAPPSFANWHGLHLAAENFAFQDFPIILATFGLSNAECDR